MIEIVAVTMRNQEAFRRVRLRALQEDPAVFGSTYARGAAFSEDEWAARVQRWNGELGVGFLAMDADVVCGLAGALLEEDGRAQLVSMWTAPECGRAGVGQRLLEAVMEWAEKRRVPLVRLKVTSTNQGAERFYAQLGFVRTGNTTPYPNDPDVFEWEMVRGTKL